MVGKSKLRSLVWFGKSTAVQMKLSGCLNKTVSGDMELMGGNETLNSPEVSVLSMKIKRVHFGSQGRMGFDVGLRVVGNLTPRAQVKSGPLAKITLYGWEVLADFGTMMPVVGNR